MYRCRYYIERNYYLTRNDDVLKTLNENANTNFNRPCATANDTNSGLYNAVQCLMDDVIKEFMAECFIKYIIFGENSVCNNFHDEDSANNHDTLANNNSNDACIRM